MEFEKLNHNLVTNLCLDAIDKVLFLYIDKLTWYTFNIK